MEKRRKGIIGTRGRRAAGAALAVTLGLLSPFILAQSSVPAPQSGRPQAGFVITSQTNLVLVDVRVTDKSGKPVSDLKQEDFRIWEDGVPQTITSFSLESVERLAQASGEAGPPPVIDLGKLPPQVTPAQAVQDHRLLVLFFDQTSMQVDDLMRSLKSADDFVRTKVTPADLVAVVAYTSSLRILQNFTNDRDSLQKALKGLRPGEASSLAELGAAGEAGTTDALGQEVVTQDVSAAFTPDETEFNIFNTDEKLAAIESLAKMLRDVPGRKAVLHFSSGVQRTGVDNQAQLRATTDAANQANVSLYTVDARGLAALPPGGDASSASPSGTALYSGQAVASQVSSLQGGRETLAALAADTGGRTFYDLNDFSPAFQQIQSDNSSYYMLGYSPTNRRSDGRFRRIRVQVSRPGVKVEARPGYFAPKDFRQFTREDKELQLQQAVELDAPFVDLPFVVDTAYFRQGEKKVTVVLAAKIPGSAVSFLQKSRRHETQFDFVWRVTDASNKVAGVLRDTLPVKVAGENYELLLSGNILYEGTMTLPPGKYHLTTLVRENQSGKMGTFEQDLDLPGVNDSGLLLSSVVLSNEVKGKDESARGRARQSKESGESPLEAGNRSILPSVTRVFRTNQTLSVYLESYGRKAATAGPGGAQTAVAGLQPSLGLAFFRGGRKIAEAGPFAGKQEKSANEKASFFVQIPLEKFPPGRYTLQVNVLDPARDRVAFARVPLAVVTAPPRPTPPTAGE
jgi:VWFA-related protein